MIRTLKALGLALVASLAVSAFAASATLAQQGELTVEDGQATLSIPETGATYDNAITAFGGKIHCPGTFYTGHEVGSVTDPVQSGATTITATPHYATVCVATDGSGTERSATVEKSGCDFVYHIGSTVSTNTWGVTADVVCPSPSTGIHVSIYAHRGAHLDNNKLCTMEITGTSTINKGLTGPHVNNTPEILPTDEYLDLKGTFTGVHVERTGLCIFDGQGTTTNAGAIHINVKLKGTDDDENEVGIAVSD